MHANVHDWQCFSDCRLVSFVVPSSWSPVKKAFMSCCISAVNLTGIGPLCKHFLWGLHASWIKKKGVAGGGNVIQEAFTSFYFDMSHRKITYVVRCPLAPNMSKHFVWVSSGCSGFPHYQNMYVRSISSHYPWPRYWLRSGVGPWALCSGCPLRLRMG